MSTTPVQVPPFKTGYLVADSLTDIDVMSVIQNGIDKEVPLSVLMDYTSTVLTAAPIGTIAIQDADAVAITGGTINATTIGATTPASIRAYQPINPQVGTTYTLALTDSGKLITFTGTDPVTVTVPKHSVIAFPVGAEVSVAALDTGLVAISPVDGTVTIISISDYVTLAGAGAVVRLKQVASNVWLLSGDLVVTPT